MIIVYIYRDCPFHPNTPSAFTNGIIMAVGELTTQGSKTSRRISAWKASAYFNNSKSVYSSRLPECELGQRGPADSERGSHTGDIRRPPRLPAEERAGDEPGAHDD